MATPESIALAAELLRQKEGIRSKPYWDVNALRAGYGSDTTTLADGTVKRITKDTVVSKEDAERDLARRVTDFANIAQKEIGANFSNLTPQAQAAITSVAYNYGTTKKVAGLVKAAQAGDNAAIAKAIAGAAGHNNGVNRQRRLDEAAIVLGKKQLTPNALTIDSVAGYNGAANVPNPQSQLGDVKSYNSQMVQAAQKIADNNLAAVNNFGWNPTVEGSQAQNFGKAVQRNTGALTATDQELMNRISRYNPDGTKKGLGSYIFDHTIGMAGETINQAALQAMQREQSVTGDSLEKQVANMKTTMKNTVIDPAFLDKAAGNLTQQQQVENQTYNAVTGNANTQQQLKQQLDIANMQNETEQAKIALATQKANGVIGNPDDSSLVSAANSLGIQLPEGMKTSDIKAVLGDKLAAVQAVAANNGSLGSDPYTAVQIVNQLGSAAPPELVKQAMQHSAFQQEIIKKIPAKEFRPVDDTLPKNTIAANTAYNDNVKRVNINKAYAEASVGDLDLPNNPYTATGNLKTLSNGIPLPKGIEAEDVGKLSAAQFVNKAIAEGSSAVEIANFYKQLTSARTSTTQYKTFNAPEPTGNFLIKIKGVDSKINLASPAGIEQLQALNKTYGITNTGTIGSKFMQMFSGAGNDAQTSVSAVQYMKVRDALNSPLK